MRAAAAAEKDFALSDFCQLLHAISAAAEALDDGGVSDALAEWRAACRGIGARRAAERRVRHRGRVRTRRAELARPRRLMHVSNRAPTLPPADRQDVMLEYYGLDRTLKESFGRVHVSPKYECLVEELDAEFTRLSRCRVLVFVATKALCRRLAAALQARGAAARRGASSSSLARVQARHLVGHGTHGHSVARQKRLLRDFETGAVNVLVATTVLEEGIDVAGCSLVVRHDAAASLTALIQSRGRARWAESRFVAITTDQREARLDALRREEEAMAHAVLHVAAEQERDGEVH